MPRMNLASEHFDAKLLAECRRSVERHEYIKSPTSSQLLQQVAGSNATENDYLYGGFGSSVGIRAALHSLGKSIYESEAILDFGCGPARIIRWFRDVSTRARLFGCDLNAPAIEWCKDGSHSSMKSA